MGAATTEIVTGAPPSLSVEEGLASICLQRPAQANRREDADLHCLLRHFDAIEADPSIRVVRLQAQGRHLCAGYNVGDLPAGADGALFERVTERLENLRPVTLAEVQGGVYGGASDLALACDFRLGSAAAVLQMPAARFGLHLYGGLLQRYVSRLGLNQAKRLILTAEKLAAEELLAIGFLTELLDSPQALAERGQQLAGQIAALAPLALAGMKQQLNAIARGSYDPLLQAENVRRCNASADFQEGLAALAQRRAPCFEGR